jgi:phenylalanyl-tRNA synthetase beta chain
MNPDQALLRASLLPNLLQKAAHNARDYERFGLFECGSVFFQEKGKALEEKHTAIVSLRAAGSDPKDAFFDLKGRLEAAIGALTAQTNPRTVFEPLSAEEAALFPFLHPKKSARILFDGEPLGVLGELRTPLLRELRLAKRGVALFEGPLAPWLELASREPSYVPLSRYPVVRRDISLAFPREVTVGQVEALFQEAGAPLLCSVELFDTYEQGEEKSLAFHLVFGSEERTLEGAEVDHAFERIVAQAAERLSGRLRS